MSAAKDIVITGLGIEAPGVPDVESLLTLQSPLTQGEFDPAPKLGRRGLRYKDRATKLALCAVRDALARSGLATQECGQLEATGVIVSSNLGNVDSVCESVQTLRSTSVEALSPMSLPNLSSNNIASSIAIRFGCRQVNLTVCNGATSGLEALYLATTVIKAGRASRMLVVGVEPRNEVVHRLMTTSQQKDSAAPVSDLRLGDGAACVVLETASDATRRNAPLYGVITGYGYAPPGREPETSIFQALGSVSVHPHLWLTPNHYRAKASATVDKLLHTWEDTRPEILDLGATLGEMYGAAGVFQCVAACLWLQRRAIADQAPNAVVLATVGGAWRDGVASLCIGNWTSGRDKTSAQ